MVTMDRDDDYISETSVLTEDAQRQARHVGRLLKQGFRHFRMTKGSGFVVSFNMRRQTAVIERGVRRKKSKTGKLLKKPRIERVTQVVPFHTMRLVLDRGQLQHDACLLVLTK